MPDRSISCSNASSGRSRRSRQTGTSCSGATSIVELAGNATRTRLARAPILDSSGLCRCSDSAHAQPRAIGAGAADLVLQLEDPVDQRLGGRRTARHVDVDRHDAVAAAHDRIGIVVVAAAVGAGTHRDHPARLGHLVIDLAQRRGHLVDQRAGDDHHVGLARAAAEHDAEAVEVIARRAGMHHLDRAAGKAEGHRPQRAGPRPVHQVVDRRRDESPALDDGRFGGQSHSSAPFFHS